MKRIILFMSFLLFVGCAHDGELRLRYNEKTGAYKTERFDREANRWRWLWIYTDRADAVDGFCEEKKDRAIKNAWITVQEECK